MAAAGAAALVVAAGLAARAGRRPWRRPRLGRGRADGLRAYPLRAPWWATAPIAEMAPGRDPDTVWTAALVLTGVAVVAAWQAGGIVVAVLTASAAAGLPTATGVGLRAQARRRAGADVPTALEAAARSLRAGATLPTALADAAGAVGPVVGAAVAEVVAATARGQPLVDALDVRRAGDGGVPGLRLAFTALAVAAETGGAQAAALDGVAATLRQRLAANAEAAALGSQARMSAWVIVAAPVAFAALNSASDRADARFLLHTPTGLALLSAGLALDGAGALWMRRLTRIGVP